jgi:hypothetical protein
MFAARRRVHNGHVRISKRTGLAVALLALTVVPFAWVGLAPAKTSAPGSKQVGCGVERWSVKTLKDAAGRALTLSPKATTIRALRRKAVPGYLGLRRGRGVERTTFRVRAKLVEMKLEADSDIHLVIADPTRTGATMIAEFPARSCTVGATPRARTKMNRARTALIAACGPPTGSFRKLSGSATVTGVGFFDQIHGQTGVAPNGIELHPVVGFSGRCGAAPPPPPPPSGGSCAASYPTVCIPPPPPDLNCADIPYTNFTVRWDVPDPDPHHFDGNRDGVGCES